MTLAKATSLSSDTESTTDSNLPVVRILELKCKADIAKFINLNYATFIYNIIKRRKLQC